MNTTSGKVRLATYEEVKKMMSNGAGGRLVKTMLVELAGGGSKSVTVGCKYDYVKIYSVGDIGCIFKTNGSDQCAVTYGQTLLVCNPSEKMMVTSGVTVSIKNEIISFANSNGYNGFAFHVEAYKYD